MSQTNAVKEEGGFESVRLNLVREAAAMLHLPLGTMYKLVWQRHTSSGKFRVTRRKPPVGRGRHTPSRHFSVQQCPPISRRRLSAWRRN